MRKLFLFVLGVFLVSSSYAGTKSIYVKSPTGGTLTHVTSKATAYTKAVHLKNAKDRIAILYRVSNDKGTSEFDYIDLEMSYRPPQGDIGNSAAVPDAAAWSKTNEGTYDALYVSTDALTIVTGDNLWRVTSIDTLKSLPYARFRMKAGANNADDTHIQFIIGYED